MKTMFTKICMFAIKEDGLQLVKKVVALPPYSREDEFNAFLGSAKRDLTAKDFRDAGFEELVDGERMSPVGVSYTKMGDDAKCYYYKHGFLPIERAWVEAYKDDFKTTGKERFAAAQKRANKILGAWHEKDRERVVKDVVEKAFSKIPEGGQITPEIYKQFVEDLAIGLAKYLTE